jgi:hypothetical protein
MKSSFTQMMPKALLEGMGFNMVRYYPGGKEDWMQARLPLESYDY